MNELRAQVAIEPKVASDGELVSSHSSRQFSRAMVSGLASKFKS